LNTAHNYAAKGNCYKNKFMHELFSDNKLFDKMLTRENEAALYTNNAAYFLMLSIYSRMHYYN